MCQRGYRPTASDDKGMIAIFIVFSIFIVLIYYLIVHPQLKR